MKKPRSPRCDGWTAPRRASFIAALATGATPRAAAAHAGPSPSSAYRLYRRDPAFAAAWDGATTPRPVVQSDRLVQLASLTDRNLMRRLDRQRSRERPAGVAGL